MLVTLQRYEVLTIATDKIYLEGEVEIMEVQYFCKEGNLGEIDGRTN